MDDWPLWGLFISAFLSSTILPGGSEIALAALAKQTDYSLVLLISLATLGNTLGGVTSYLIGYSLPQLDQKHQTALAKLKRYGSPLLLLSWLPVVGDPLCVVAGWCKMNFWWSTFYIGAGKLLRYLVIVFSLNYTS